MTFYLRRSEELSPEELQQRLAENPREAARLILAAARESELEAQALLGQILLDGHGIQRDPALAITWFRIAAERGQPMARNMLGRCLEHGWGCAANAAEAARHYRIAADAGLDWAMYNLANLHATGRGVALDQQRAFALYQSAARLGHAKSLNLLGRYYEEGLVVERDLDYAFACYLRSAEGGDFRGQFSHAAVLAAQGRLAEAEDWLRRALEGGNLNFLRVARSQLEGSPHRPLRQLALDYYQRAAELGDDADLQALQDAAGRFAA
ncbi:Secretory immunoglobulin A-binding protein EsiB [compost metagenome]